MNYIVDVIILALVVFIVYRSAKKGIIATLLSCVSVVLSSVGAAFVAPKIADYVYRIFVEDTIRSKLNSIVNNGSLDGLNLVSKLNKLLTAFPQTAINMCNKFGVSVNSLLSPAKSSGIVTNEQLVDFFMDKVAYSVMIFLIKSVLFVILFIIIAFIIKFLSKFLSSFVKKLPLVGNVNTALGGALGVLKAIVLVVVVCTVLYFFCNGSNNEEFVTAINASKIYGFITDINPLLQYFH